MIIFEAGALHQRLFFPCFPSPVRTITRFSTAGKSLSDVVAINFYNRAAATFFKDITTTGALLTLMVYGSGGVAANLDEAEAAYRRRPRRLFAGLML